MAVLGPVFFNGDDEEVCVDSKEDGAGGGIDEIQHFRAHCSGSPERLKREFFCWLNPECRRFLWEPKGKIH